MTNGDHADLAAKMAALEERMNTRQAEYKTDIALLAKEAAERDREAAKREARLEREIRNGLRWQIGFTLGGIAIAVALIGILIRM